MRGKQQTFALLLIASGLLGFLRTAQAATPPTDDWASDLTECVWTNGVTTSCSLTMSSPVASMTISGTNTNTTKENLGVWSILTRQFDANYPTIGFLTDGIGGMLSNVTFKHVHNHNAGMAPSSYTVQLEFKDGNGTWSSFGSPFTASTATSGTTETITAASDVVLLPNTNYAIRWTTTYNGASFSNVTKSDFFSVSDLNLRFKKNQTISITQAPTATAGSTTAVAASSTSGLPLTWVGTSGVCSATSTSSGADVTLLSAGTCTVTASQAGDAVWVAATTQTMSFNVAAAATTTTTTTTTTSTTTSVATSTTTVSNQVFGGQTTLPAPVPVATTIPAAAAVRASAPAVVAAATTTTTAAVVETTTAPATTAPAPTVTLSGTAADDGPPQLVPAGLDLAVLGSAPVRLMSMSTTMQAGHSVAGATVSVSARGLASGSTVAVTILPGPVVLSTQAVDSAGTAEFSVTIPPELPAGTYSIVGSGQTADNGPVSSIIHFEIDSAGSATTVLPSYETVGPPPSESKIARALQAGLAPYDVVREVPTTATITMSAVILTGLAGATGLAAAGGQSLGSSRRRSYRRSDRRTGNGPGERDATTERHDAPPAPNSSTEEPITRDTDAEGSFGSADANLFDASTGYEEHWGDRLRPWVSFGYARFDTWLRSAVAAFSTRSVLATRLVQDGTWMRAVGGSAEIVVLLAGLLAGVTAALSVHSMALPPSLLFVTVIAVSSLLNGLSGALAWLGFALVVIVHGNITSIFDLRTLIGLGFVFFALPSIASAIRPIYDDGSRNIIHRIGDYVMMPVFLAYGSAAIYTALNGLSGLSVVSAQDATALRNTVFVAAIARLGVEDIVRRGFPVRVATVSIEPTGTLGTGAKIMKLVFAAALYTMAIVTFYGWGARTVQMIVLVSAVPVLRLFADAFPNLAWLHRWFPRGILRTVVMVFVGTWYGRFIMTIAHNPVDTRRIAVLLLLPGVVLGLIDCFAREGGEWPERAAKHAAGFALWLFTLAVLVGAVSI